MYCKYCGKFIATNADVCDDCMQKFSTNTSTQQQFTNQYQQAQYQQAQYQQPQYQQPQYQQPQYQQPQYQQPQYQQTQYQQPQYQQPQYQQTQYQQPRYQQPRHQQPRYQQPRYKTHDNDSEINLGNAIAGVILSSIGFILAFAFYYLDLGILGLLLGLTPCIIGFAFGLKSISNFKETSYIKSGKRIPVLIMGIASTAQAGLGWLFFVLAMIA